jgi:hypothetical protein
MTIRGDSHEEEIARTVAGDGGAYVMWKGAPYAHLMVPVGSRDE